jgi:hypothetical protein
MIIHTEIEGRSATLQYLTLERVPTTEEDAEMVYIVLTMTVPLCGLSSPKTKKNDEDEPED